MNISMRWLSDYYDVKAGIDEYVSDLTMSGTKVEGYEKENENIKNVVVGRVLSVVPHSNADTLVICQIDVGDREVQIVTGADNVVAGALVPVALHKSLLPNGTKITKGKLRGELSEGMLCSLAELNLTLGDFPYAIEDGIFLIEEDCNPGDPIDKALGLDDTIVEFEITSNRPDCMSVLGIARETAATYGDKLVIHTPEVKAGGSDINDIISVEVENTELCQRYMAAAVENVKIGPSPRWIRERLRASGVRPINNIVDITNFVMLEYGHPMHAFDLRHVEDAKIVVRNAKAGEKITTLDGEERELDETMLVIADSKNPSAVAGVMGGEYSGVYADTQTVIFESACFQRATVRHTARKLGMRTESSGRFEKGLDSRNCEAALKRAMELVELLGVGTVANGVIDKDYDKRDSKRLPFEPKWINEFIGVEIPESEMVTILDNLGFAVENGEAIVPSFRDGDMTVRNDIAEEIARIYGYNKIPNTILRGESKAMVTREQHYKNTVSRALIAQGYSEIVTYSFFSPKNYDKIRLEENSPLRDTVRIRNPLGEDTSVLRTTAIPSMLITLGYNYNNRNAKANLFEIATKYIRTGNTTLPEEPKNILIGQYGQGADFFTIKGAIEALLESVSVKNAEYKAVKDNPTFHSGRCAEISVDGRYLGIVGEIHPLVAANYGLGEHTYIAELDYQELLERYNPDHIYRPMPKFPASTRDLALVADRDMPVGEIEKTIRESIGGLLENIELFDLYEGSQIDEGKKSAAFALILRAPDRTLTDKECDDAVSKALKALESINVKLRG